MNKQYNKLAKVDYKQTTFEEFCDEFFGKDRKKNYVEFRNIFKMYLKLIKQSHFECKSYC